MALGQCNMCQPNSFKLILILMFVIEVFVMANGQHGQVVKCYTDDPATCMPSWICATCAIQCPAGCDCALANFSEVILNCPDGNISVIQVAYPSKITRLNWAHSEIHSIEKHSFVGLVDTMLFLLLNNNSLQHLQPGVFEELNIWEIDVRHNMLEEIGPDVFRGLGHLTWLDVSRNKLKNIASGGFESLGKLRYLNLSKNFLQKLQPGVFRGLVSLSWLYLHQNKLQQIHLGAFDGLPNLWELNLSKNLLKQLQLGTFNGLTNLVELDLSNNWLKVLQPYEFRGFKQLEMLYLENNLLDNFLPASGHDLTNLTVLSLSHNPLAYLRSDSFQNLATLDTLWLQNVSLESLPDGIFSSLGQLHYLDLSENNLNRLPIHLFQKYTVLETLNLTQNPLRWIKKETFSNLNETANIFVDNYASCCFIEEAVCYSKPPESPFLTCKRLFPYPVLRVGIWVVSILALLNNVQSLFVKFRQKQQTNPVHFLLITNLSVSDFLMGVYLIILLAADLYYMDHFPSHSESWRSSTLCKIAGSFCVLSCEASVFFVTLISIDRFLRVKFPFSKPWLNNISAKTVIFLLWSFALGLSIASFVLPGMGSDIYAVSEICVGLPISRQQLFTSNKIVVRLSNLFNSTASVLEYNAWGNEVTLYFSFAIFTILNLSCFIIVGLCYAATGILIWHSSKKSGLSISRSEVRIAKKMVLLVLTDFCCWVPIAVLSILVQAGTVEVNPVAYAWIATFILPINSSINPFLYTLGDVIADKLLCSSCKPSKCRNQNVEMKPKAKSK